jgi:hypothetical protein
MANVRNTTVITAKVQSNSTGPNRVQVVQPSSGTSSNFKLRALGDVNSSTLTDGSMIQYDATTDKFVTKTTIESNTGTIIFNGGNF